jgi:aspartyl protease family protein
MRTLFAMIVALGLFVGLVAGRLQAPRVPAGQQPILVNESTGGNETAGTYAAAEAMPSNDGALELQREPNGHFFADVEINGAKIHMLVDTGATEIALSREDARSARIATSIGMPNVVGEGADGSVHGEVVTVDHISLGNAKADGMQAIVLNNGGQSLLGQSFLAKFASVEIHGDTMTLR